jgi:hypothetical protein
MGDAFLAGDLVGQGVELVGGHGGLVCGIPAPHELAAGVKDAAVLVNLTLRVSFETQL